MKFNKGTKKPWLLGSFCLLLLLTSILYFKFKISPMAVEGWSAEVEPYFQSVAIDSAIKKKFLNKIDYSTKYRYNELFKYFAYGNIKYQSREGAHVFYPGEISTRGRKINGLEGFARFFPLAASWLYSNHTENITLNNKTYNLIHILKKGLIAGTDPANPEYWGNVGDKDQRIVESADIALAIWICRDQLWVTLDMNEKLSVVKWLEQSVNKEIVDNNWNLFPITIVKVLEALGFSNEKDLGYVNHLYKTYKINHYLGEGWFDDPPKGIDYYNAWSIQYSLFWLDQIDPNFDSEFIRDSHSQFVNFYKHLFSENGFPIMGRSVCYRLAAPAPIVSAALINPLDISTGSALRTLDLTWMHFIQNNVLKDGKLTQGYYEDDVRLLDSYSGAGSCLWSLRSLIIAFYIDEKIPFWTAEQKPIPIDKFDFEVTNNSIGWTVVGDKSKEKITIKIKNNINNDFYPLIDQTIYDKLKEDIIKRPFRPNNQNALYKNHIYTTDAEILSEN